VYYLEIACGENAHAALDYSLHYRSPRLMGMDPDYQVSKAYSATGWPTFVVIDAEGIIRFHGFDPDKNLSRLRRVVEELAPRTPEAKPVLSCGVALLPEALAARQARRDRSPRLAFDKAGNPNLVFYSNRDGTNAVYWRRYNPKGAMVSEERLSPPLAECYAADCAFDTEGTLWTVWCGRQDRFFDIYVQARHEGAQPVTQPLTHSADDAMSPKIATGPGGVVSVAYYKWATLWGSSRDRNIFARTYDPARKAWSEEVEVSPHEPAVEDHTDPDVVLDAKGQPWVVWSFDYHPELYRGSARLEAAQPTIFAAHISSNHVSAPLLVGASGKYQYAIDLFPSAAIDAQGTLWCAWDCDEPQRGIRLARLNAAGDKFGQVNSFGKAPEVCSTPELSAAGSDLLLTFSKRVPGGHWQGQVVLLKAGLPTTAATLSESVDVLFPQAQQAPDGQYWVTYEKAEAKGATLVLRNVTRELAAERQ
jgi:hypothetical protein